MVDAGQKTPTPMSVFNDRECQISVIAHTWSVIGPKVGPTAVAASLRVPAGLVVHFKMALLDDDGHEVIPVIQGDATAPAVQAGLPAGTLADVSIPILVGPLPQLQPGRSYEWRLWVNGETHDHWRKPFFVRPDLPMAG